MYTLRRTLVSATAIVAMVQYCPAPFLAVIPEAVAVGLETASDVIDVVGGKYSTISVCFDDDPRSASMALVILIALRFSHIKGVRPDMLIRADCVGGMPRRESFSNLEEAKITLQLTYFYRRCWNRRSCGEGGQ